MERKNKKIPLFILESMIALSLLGLLPACNEKYDTWSGEYCRDKSCTSESGVKTLSGYDYPGDDESCPDKLRKKIVDISFGDFSVPIYRTLYLKQGSCRIDRQPSPTPNSH